MCPLRNNSRAPCRASDCSIRCLQAELSGRQEQLKIQAVLGKGSFGVVYLGTWRGLRVAVKTLVVHDALLGREVGLGLCVWGGGGRGELAGTDEERASAACLPHKHPHIYTHLPLCVSNTYARTSVHCCFLYKHPCKHTRVQGRQRHRAILEAAISKSLQHPHCVSTYAAEVMPLAAVDATATAGKGAVSVLRLPLP